VGFLRHLWVFLPAVRQKRDNIYRIDSFCFFVIGEKIVMADLPLLQTSDVIVWPATRFQVYLKWMEYFGGDKARSQHMEEIIYEMYNGIEQLYREKMVQLWYNMTNNPKLLEHRNEQLIYMSDADLCKHTEIEKQRQKQTRKRKRVQRIIKNCMNVFEDETEEGGDWITCGKCKSRKILWTQKQIRAADESMTVFCTCENCHNRWTM
jgi:DNA-directed RNA polymerase subunit M/transcription elongation factor TFIIS